MGAETDSVSESTTRRPRNSIGLLTDPLFGTIFWGKLLVGIGVWLHNLVAVVLTFQITGSAMWVGVVSAVQFAPQILLSPIGGKYADRGYLVSLVVSGRIICMAGSGGLAL